MYVSRLSVLMNKKISMDESNIESISTSNRPLKLADDFKDFCSKEWMGAKEAVDSKTSLPEKDKCIFLNRILWVIIVLKYSWIISLTYTKI